MANREYRFIATGQDSVVNAYKSIASAARDAQRAQASASRSSSGGSSPEAKRAKDTAKSYAQVEAAIAKSQERVNRQFERSQAKEAKVAERTAAQKAKAAERAAAAQIRAQEKVSRAAETSEQKQIRAAEKAAAARERAAERSYQKVVRSLEREASAAERAAERAKRTAKSGPSRLERFGSVAGQAGWGLAGAAVGAVGSAVALGGSAARDSMRLNEMATRIAINARGSGETMTSATDLRREFEDTALSTPGVKAVDVADAVQRFVSLTGDLQTARRGQKTFATVASATGANIGDVAEASASLSTQLGIKDVSQMQDVLSTLVAQGKGGAFELKDMAAMFQRVAAGGASFGVDKSAGGVKTLGGLLQLARTGTGSAEEATTATENLFMKMKTESGSLKKEGIDVYDEKGKTRNISDLIVESISKIGGADIEKKNADLTKIFDVRAMRALNPLIGTFQDTYQKTGGGEQEKMAAATRAVREQLERFTSAPGKWSDVVQDAAEAQKMGSARMSQAWEQLVGLVSERLTPTITQVIGKFLDMATNTNAMDNLVTMLVALAEAAELAADGLKSIGLLKPKEDGPAEKVKKLKKAEQELAEFDKGMLIDGPPTAQQAQQRDALAAKVEDAYSQVWTKKMPKNLTDEQFAMQYAALGGGGSQKVLSAQMLTEEIRKDPLQFDGGNPLSSLQVYGENPLQETLRRQFQEQTVLEKGGKGIDVEKANESLKAFIAQVNAATSATQKLASSGGGSIVAGQ